MKSRCYGCRAARVTPGRERAGVPARAKKLFPIREGRLSLRGDARYAAFLKKMNLPAD